MRYNHGLREPSTQLVPPIVWQAEGHMPFGNFGACWAMTCLNSAYITYITFSLIPTFNISILQHVRRRVRYLRPIRHHRSQPHLNPQEAQPEGARHLSV